MRVFNVKLFCVLLFQGFLGFQCAIIGSPSKQNVHNIVGKNDPKSTHKISLEVATTNPGNYLVRGYGTRLPKDMRNPSKMTAPLNHTKLDKTQTIHPASSQSKIHNEKTPEDAVLKNEVPKVDKKYHRFTIEELRKRRKELREKWQARHALLRSNNINYQSKHEQHVEQPKPVKEIKKVAVMDHPNHQHHIYEQVTPRSRRILEHKEDEETLQLPKPYKSNYPFSARLSSKTLSPIEAFNRKLQQSSTSTPTVRSSTESVSNTNHISLPIIPHSSTDPHYSSVGLSSLPPTSAARSANSESTFEASEPNINAALVSQNSHSRNPESSEDSINESRSSDIKPFGYGPFAETLVSPVFIIPVSNQPTSANPNDSKLGAVAEHSSTSATKSTSDDVVSVKIEPTENSAFAQRVYTMKINTPPSYRNMTFYQKLQDQIPILPYGRVSNADVSATKEKNEEDEKNYSKNEKTEAHQVSDLVDSTEDVGTAEETAKNKKSSQKLQIRHGKRSSEHTTSSSGGSAMKIAEDSHIYKDWRENLKKAVKERLRELSEDSA